MECGRYDQVGRPTDAGREVGRRTIVRTSVAALSDSAGQFPVPDGAKPGAGGRSGPGSLYSSVPRAGRVRAEREVHHLAFPDCNKPGGEFAAGPPVPGAAQKWKNGFWPTSMAG